MSDYSYPAAGRLARPEDIEDLGAFPPSFSKEAKPENPLQGLARSRTPAAQEATDSAPASMAPTDRTTHDPEVSRSKTLHRPSTAMLPSTLVELVGQKRRTTGWSAGTVLIQAIEATYDELLALLTVEGTPRAAGFSTREYVPGAAALDDRELTSIFAFRMSGADFDNLDRLVEELGARNRTHLMKTALTAYFKDDLQ